MNGRGEMGFASRWGDDLDLDDDEDGDGENHFNDEDDLVFSDDDDDDDDENGPSGSSRHKHASSTTPHVLITPGPSLTAAWTHSTLPRDPVAAGDIDSAFRLLHRQLGVVRGRSLTESVSSVAIQAYLSTQAVMSGFPGMPSLTTPVLRSVEPCLPFAGAGLMEITQTMKKVMKLVQNAKFEECEQNARRLLEIIPFTVVASKEEEAELRGFVEMAREYILAAKLDAAKRSGDEVRALECVCLMSDCRLHNAHILLTLHSAMVAAYKQNNFIDAASFARRILSHSDINAPKNASLEVKAKKVLVRSEKEGRNEVTTHYRGEHAQTIDASSLQVIASDKKKVKCPYCSAVYEEVRKVQREVCSVCGLSRIGEETLGLVCMRSH